MKKCVRPYFLGFVGFSKKVAYFPLCFGCFARFAEIPEKTLFGQKPLFLVFKTAKSGQKTSWVLTVLTKLTESPSLDRGFSRENTEKHGF